MKIRQFEAIRAVVTTGTTTRAAQLLGLTQSAVSRLIMQLEDELGFKVFNRQRGRLNITPEGREFFHVADQILTSIDQIKSTANDCGSHAVSALRVVAMPAIGSCLLSVPVDRLTKKYKSLRVTVHLLGRSQLQSAIADGKYDIGMATLPIEQEGVDIEPVCRVRAVCIVPKTHPLADAEIVTAQDLEGERFISKSGDTILRYKTDCLFSELGVQRQLTVEAGSTVLAGDMVALGMGVSIVHPFVAERFRSSLAIKEFEPKIELDYGLLYPSGVARSMAIRDLAEEISKVFSQNGSNYRFESFAQTASNGSGDRLQ